MDLQLRDQVVIIWGGASGIGRATANSFAAEGARVAIADISEARQQTTADIGAAHGVEVLALPVDITDYASVTAVVDKVVTQWQRCDHSVVTAGIGSGKYGFPFWNLEPSDWDKVYKVNVLGPVHVAHALVSQLTEHKTGTITFLSSVAAQIGSQTDPPYSAAKAAVINFTQCAAKDYAKYGVRVNCISPGMIKTPLNRSVWQAWHDQQPESERLDYDSWAQSKIATVTPLARWQSPDDVAQLATFLASEKAKNITGQTLNVDGGQVMHW